MLVHDVVDTTTSVAATTKRPKKRAALADRIRRAQPDEIEPLSTLETLL